MPLELVRSWDNSQDGALLQAASVRYLALAQQTFSAFLKQEKIGDLQITGSLGTRRDTPLFTLSITPPSDCDALTNTKIFASLNQARINADVLMDRERISPSLMWREVAIEQNINQPEMPVPYTPPPFAQRARFRLVETPEQP